MFSLSLFSPACNTVCLTLGYIEESRYYNPLKKNTNDTILQGDTGANVVRQLFTSNLVAALNVKCTFQIYLHNNMKETF